MSYSDAVDLCRSSLLYSDAVVLRGGVLVTSGLHVPQHKKSLRMGVLHEDSVH